MALHPHIRGGPPHFQPGQSPDPSSAKHDQLQVVIDGVRLRYVSRRRLLERLRQIGNGRVFALRRSGQEVYRFHFRQGFLPRGQIVLRFPRAAGPGVVDLRIHRWNLNPTTFVAHQSVPPGQVANLEPIDALARSIVDASDAVSLDGNSNIIVGRSRLEGVRHGLWRRVLHAYLGQLSALLHDEFGPEPDPWQGAEQLGQLGTLLEFDNARWSVQYGEVYWEYRSEDAIEVVASIERALARSGNEITTTLYALTREPPTNRRYSRGRQVNSPVVGIDLGSRHVRLRVYAKHWDRLRFEVCYSGNAREQIRPAAPADTFGPGIDGVCALLDAINADASQRLDVVLRGLRLTRADTTPRRGQLARLLAFISAAAGQDPTLANRIVRLLLSSDGISADPNFISEAAVFSLERSGVIIRTRTRRRERIARYEITERYLPVLNSLRNAAG